MLVIVLFRIKNSLCKIHSWVKCSTSQVFVFRNEIYESFYYDELYPTTSIPQSDALLLERANRRNKNPDENRRKHAHDRGARGGKHVVHHYRPRAAEQRSKQEPQEPYRG